MQIRGIINQEDVTGIMVHTLNKIHIQGPIFPKDLETLAYIKKFQPEVFKKYESKLISVMGLFYKTNEPKSFIEHVYSIFAKTIEESTGKEFTPVQADAYNNIKEQTFFSFSAPTSAGKSHLFREIIKEQNGDIIIVVPSRALITEYVNIVIGLVDKSVLVLPFIDIINKSKSSRRIFIITPERGNELFKNLRELDNIKLFLFDEAQLSEEGIRGMKFDSFVRRVSRLIPGAKKVFAHPFIDNPEAQINKHPSSVISPLLSKSVAYRQHSVGKIFLFHEEGKFNYFSPYQDSKNIETIEANSDIVEEKIRDNKSVLIYVSKSSIYEGECFKKFQKYTELCSVIKDPEALKYVEELKKFIGADSGIEKHSLLVDLMMRGIVVHHGSMPLKARLIVEEYINKRYARICFSTSTLAQGINMPFDVIWIENFHFGEYPETRKALDLKNLIGRAGRSTKDEKESFDYGYVIIKKSSLSLFKKRIRTSSILSEKSKLYEEDLEKLDVDELDIVTAIKEDSFDDVLQLTNEQVERIKTADIDNDILLMLNNLIIDGMAITGSQYYLLKKSLREKIQESFKRVFISHLRRKELSPAEQAILSTSIPILLWQIQGKSFSAIIGHRYAFLSEKDKRKDIEKRVENNEISPEEGGIELSELKIRYSPLARAIPDSTITPYPIYPNASVTKIQYDVIMYDTYDYIDKVIGQCVKDPLSSAFLIYYDKTKDERARVMSNYIKYGTDSEKQIWLIRYGFSFDDIEWIEPYVEHVDADGIEFFSDVTFTDEQRKVVERYL